MNESKKVFFIINKYSGTGYQNSFEGRIIDRCRNLKMECAIEFTRERGHATELARAAAEERFDFVFAVGGDGTVNEVAKGLMHSDSALGIIPKGSGNGLARHLGIPLHFPKALDLLSASQTIEMDSIFINDLLSVNVSGIGFDGHIASLFGKNGKRGLANYTRLVVREFMKFEEFPARIRLDGEEFQSKNFAIAIANSSQFGNNARVAPHASVCDEWVDICFIKKVPLAQVVGFAKKMFAGQMNKSAFVEIRKAKRLEAYFDKPMPFHIDGEAFPPRQDFDIRIQPHSIKVLVPSKRKSRSPL